MNEIAGTETSQPLELQGDPESFLPTVKISDLVQISQEPLGQGRHHRVLEVGLANRALAFRMVLYPDDPEIVSQSLEDVKGAYELAQALPAVNEDLAKTGNKVRLTSTQPLALVVDSSSRYVGSLSPIYTEGGRVLFPEGDYNGGHAEGYRLVLERWHEFEGTQTLGELKTLLDKYYPADLQLSESLSRKLEREARKSRRGEKSEELAVRKRFLLHRYAEILENYLIKDINKGTVNTPQGVLARQQYLIDSAKRGIKYMEEARATMEALTILEKHGFMADDYGDGNLVARTVQLPDGSEILKVHVFEANKIQPEAK